VNTVPDTKRAALVTGASQGLGAAIALELARDGFDVAVTELSTVPLGPSVAAIEAVGARALAVELDVRSLSSIERAMATTLTAFPHLDVLVNNAGVPQRLSALDVTPADWDAVMDVNLKGAFFMSREMGRHLIGAKRPGAIVSLASTYGIIGFPGRVTYGISKAGIAHMTRMLAIEWAEHGIRVNAIAPGATGTPSRLAHLNENAAFREVIINRIPLRRLGMPEEMARAVCYLVSPQGSYITGQTLVLDGGLTSY
jgi:NAD(P)-dependent dehydrogenase (short-subunit alcohol dehydrogenase family)